MAEKIERIMLDMLTPISVSLRRQQYVNVDGTEYPIGEPWRRGYTNSPSGRQEVMDEVPEPYLSAIMAVWGEEPTVPDPGGQSEQGEGTGDVEGEGSAE